MSVDPKKLIVYLAGGFRSGWQDSAHGTLTDFDVLDPRSHGLTSPSDYTEWDLGAVRRCDYVLAYMEKTNPGGFALALEIGFAKALGKIVLLVEEHPTKERKRAFDMVREVADFKFSTLEDAMDFLNRESSDNAVAEIRLG